MVHLVSPVSPLSLVQPNKPDRRGKPHNGVLIPADFFSSLLEKIADQLDRLFGRGGSMDKVRRKTCEQTHSGLVGSQ